VSTKLCLACKEAIHQDAKRCPHCHQPQDRLILFFSSGWGVALLTGCLVAFGAYSLYRSQQKFSDHVSSIGTSSFKLHLEGVGESAYASCIAVVSNETKVTWREVYAEAKYFNEKNEIVDTASERLRGVVLPAKGTAIVRVLERAAQSPSAYSRCELQIKDAESR
jgi:cbb3-type cytochrome oxidase subunit 3